MTEEVRSVSATGGEKGVKEARYSLIPAEALELIAIHYGRGAKKYAEHNWRKGYEWSKSYDALQRHLAAWLMGEDIDEETGSPHLAAAAFHINTLLVFGKEFPEFDDRFATLIRRAEESKQPVIPVLNITSTNEFSDRIAEAAKKGLTHLHPSQM